MLRRFLTLHSDSVASYFQSLPASFPKSYYEELFCRESANACASVKKGHFRKTLSQEYSKLAGLRFTKRRTPLKIFFWNFFEIFQTSLRNLVSSSFLITLEPADCKPVPPDKVEIIEYSRRGIYFRTFFSRGLFFLESGQ